MSRALYNEGMPRRGHEKKVAKQPAVMAAVAGQRAYLQSSEGVADSDATETGLSSQEVEMVRRATEVLGVNHVALWMRSRIPSLGDQTPYALIQTQDGRRQVERVLLKIEHGVY